MATCQYCEQINIAFCHYLRVWLDDMWQSVVRNDIIVEIKYVWLVSVTVLI